MVFGKIFNGYGGKGRAPGAIGQIVDVRFLVWSVMRCADMAHCLYRRVLIKTVSRRHRCE